MMERNRRAIRVAMIGSVSVLAIAASLPDAVHAQSSSLPPVTVDAPTRQQARPARPSRHAAPARNAVRRPALAPQQAPAVSAAGLGDPQRPGGPGVGYVASRSVTGTKTDTSLLETPQAISVVTRQQIEDQGAQTVSEALRYTPGLSLDLYGVTAFYDWIKIRGFDAPSYLDGLRLPADATTFAVARIEPYGLDRLEVLKGPSSGLYGLSDPGGLLNMTSKRPTATPHYEVVGTFGSFDRFQGAFDIGGPIDKNGEFLYRLVGLARDSNTQIDHVQDNKLFIAPSLTWRPTTDTSFTVLAQYQKVDNRGYQQYVPGQVSLLPSVLGPVPYSRYIGEPSVDRYNLEHASIGYALEHRFNDIFQFRQNVRYMDVSNNLASVRSEGMLTDRLVSRSYNYVQARAQSVAIDNQFQADVQTGLFTHKVLVGLDYFYQVGMTDYRTAGISPLDAYAPVYGVTAIPSFNSLIPFIARDDRLSQAGVYVQDQIKFDRFTLSLTGRQDFVTTSYVSSGFYPPAGVSGRNDSATTGRVGLSYLFDFGLAPYVSYSTSFVPNLGGDSTGNSFKPTTGEGKEIGLKFNPIGTNLMFTVSLFEIDKKDILTGSPLNPLFNVQTDAARVRGFEFEAKGNVTREFEIIAGYSHLDPRVTESIAGNAGKYLPSVPLQQASLWGKYTWHDGPVAGLGIGAGVRYVGENYGDSANTIFVPDYTLFDAVVSYDFSYLKPEMKGLSAQVNLTNIGDRYYVVSCATGLAYCSLGQGRTVLGTLRYAWK